jgi:LysR family transcriptional activator of nhaA
MEFLNYHHLRYFHAIANEGSLTGAAKRLRISQSALSIQLKKLEESLGCALFDREHKGLFLTEEGRMAMDYAEVIFRSGDELLQSLSNRGGLFQRVLRVGAVATLSRNFQIDLLNSVLNNDNIEVVVRTGSLSELLNQLEAHTLDMVLSNQSVRTDSHMKLESHLIDTQVVSLIGKPGPHPQKPFVFPDDLQGRPLALPTGEASIRLAFDTLMRRTGVHPLIAVEADDMAILRLVARSTQALTLVPPVVVQDELRTGELIELHRIEEIQETFYAITAIRRHANPIVEQLLSAY